MRSDSTRSALRDQGHQQGRGMTKACAGFSPDLRPPELGHLSVLNGLVL